MSDIFISYASEDREVAHKLATAFNTLAWSVWWDRKIPTGQKFDEVIERELESATCVVVLWSHHSVSSEWVRNEAAVAAERGVLVPVVIEAVKLPLEFRRRQTGDLVGWPETLEHGGFRTVCEAIASLIGKRDLPGPAVATVHPANEAPNKNPQNISHDVRRLILTSGVPVLVAVAVIAGGFFYVAREPVVRPAPLNDTGKESVAELPNATKDPISCIWIHGNQTGNKCSVAIAVTRVIMTDKAGNRKELACSEPTCTFPPNSSGPLLSPPGFQIVQVTGAAVSR